jgi:hypothetical protein
VIFTRIATVLGLMLVGLLCWLAAAGFGPVYPFLITAVVMVVLVGGGNLIQGRSPPYGGHGSASREPESPSGEGSP